MRAILKLPLRPSKEVQDDHLTESADRTPWLLAYRTALALTDLRSVDADKSRGAAPTRVGGELACLVHMLAIANRDGSEQSGAIRDVRDKVTGAYGPLAVQPRLWAV